MLQSFTITPKGKRTNLHMLVLSFQVHPGAVFKEPRLGSSLLLWAVKYSFVT